MAKMIKVHNPFNGRQVGEVPMQDRKQVQEALDRAAAVFADRSKWLSVSERIAILEKFKKCI